MFESFQPPAAAERLRNAAIAPLAAFLFAQGYFTVYPMLARVPPALFRLVTLVLLAGTVAGVAAILRVPFREMRGRAVGWLAIAAAMTLLCARQWAAMVLPWA